MAASLLELFFEEQKQSIRVPQKQIARRTKNKFT